MSYATYAGYLVTAILLAAGSAKVLQGPPYVQLKKAGYPGVFVQGLGAVEAAIAGFSLINPAAYLLIPAIMGGAAGQHVFIEKKPVAAAVPLVRELVVVCGRGMCVFLETRPADGGGWLCAVAPRPAVPTPCYCSMSASVWPVPRACAAPRSLAGCLWPCDLAA